MEEEPRRQASLNHSASTRLDSTVDGEKSPRLSSTEVASTSPPASPPATPPQENFYAWLQVLGAFCLNLNTWGIMNSYGVFQTYYQLDLLKSYTSSDIAWIGSTQAFLLFFISIVAGPVFDAGHFRLLIWVGTSLLIVGVFLLSITHAFWQVFLTQSILMGLGFGCLYLPAPAVVSQYFHASTALAMGASSVGSAIGGAVYPIVLTHVQSKLGFGWATRILGFIVLATSVPPVVLMKSKAPPRRPRSLVDRKAFRDAPYLLFNLGMFFGLMGLYIILFYIELFALSRTDVSRNLAGYLLVIINVSSLPGRLIPGYYADKIGSINVQTSVAVISGILTLCLLVIDTTAGLMVFCVLFGFSTGAFVGLPAAGVVSLSSDKTKIGTRLGMTLCTAGFGMLISNPIAGAILGHGNNWDGLIGWCGALLLTSAICLAACRIIKVGPGLFKAL